MNPASELDSILDEDLTESFPGSDPIGVTFASGIHESDLQTFLERASCLDGDALNQR